VLLGRLRGEFLLAWGAAAVGIIGIVSALTPEFADRYHVVRGMLPPGVPGAARIALLSFALALIWLSRSLARRRRRAWALAVALVLGISVAHLVKGLDFEEAALGLVLLLALFRYRRRFDVPGDPRSFGPLLVTVCALSALALIVFVLDLRGFEGDRFDNLLTAVAILLGFRALQLWLRPLSQRVLQSGDERRAVRQLVRAHGDDSLSFFALRRDKNYFFSPTRESFLAYKVVAGCALVSGEPVGDKAELPELLTEFKRVCNARGWCLALLSVRADLLPVVRDLGLRAIKLGDEAVVRPADFSLEGRAIRKVRQSVARLEREGYSFRVVSATDVTPDLRAEVEEVSAIWRGANVERGFSMAMDDQFTEPDMYFALAERNGEVGGFLHLVPSSRGYSLSAMRRRPDTPNGLMEYLIVQLLSWAGEHDAEEISLNFCAFADLLGDEPRNGLESLARAGLRVGDRIFQLDRLLVFSRKFGPEWRPRYLCVERLADLPLVGLSYLRVESLLTPPGPWARQRPHERVSH
jgi:lysyl-tRNA synthetase class 2